MTGEPQPLPNNFSRAAWLFLAYTLAVIVFGAWVRVTGSGAGCGQHWPTCHGEIVHRPQSVETMIELTHRVTSGLCLLFAGGLMVWARREFPKPHPARWGAVLTVVFLIVEALLGAGLVAFGLVEDDDSVSRAIMMAVHLTNTCVLMAAITLAAWTGAAGVERRPEVRGSGSRAWILGAALLAVLAVSMSGAVTALGDTLYPLGSEATLGERIGSDHSVTAHFLQRMRVVHPILAVLVGLYLLWVAIALPGMASSPQVRRLGNVVAGLVLAQLCAGVANIMLSAPGWMQLSHLALATSLWVAVVVLALAALDRPSRPAQRSM